MLRGRMILEIILLISGLVALYYGSNWFIDGSVNLARILRVSPYVIGLTVVAFGTSAPEAAVSTLASAQGSGGVALGNVIGSNIANIGLIIGFCAIISCLIVHYKAVRLELFWMMGSMSLTVLLGLDGNYSLFDGLLLLSVFAVFIVTLLRAAMRTRSIRKDAAELSEDLSSKYPVSKIRCVIAIFSGLAILLTGAQVIVMGAVGLATEFGIDDYLIGVTIVAVGTSLPELAVSVMGLRKGDSEIALSNIVGSNIFNSLFVLGLAVTAGGFSVGMDTIQFNGVAMLLIGLALVILSRFFNCVGRKAGIFLFASYALFVILSIGQG